MPLPFYRERHFSVTQPSPRWDWASKQSVRFVNHHYYILRIHIIVNVLLPRDFLVFQQSFCITSCSITNDSHFYLSNRQMGGRHLRHQSPHNRPCKQAALQLNPTRTPPVYGDIYLIVFISHLCIRLCLQLF